MVDFPLTDEVVRMATLLLYQGGPYPPGGWVCDCRESCNRLSIESLQADVHGTVINASGWEYRFRAMPRRAPTTGAGRVIDAMVQKNPGVFGRGPRAHLKAATIIFFLEDIPWHGPTPFIPDIPSIPEKVAESMAGREDELPPMLWLDLGDSVMGTALATVTPEADPDWLALARDVLSYFARAGLYSFPCRRGARTVVFDDDHREAVKKSVRELDATLANRLSSWERVTS